MYYIDNLTSLNSSIFLNSGRKFTSVLSPNGPVTHKYLTSPKDFNVTQQTPTIASLLPFIKRKTFKEPVVYHVVALNQIKCST